MIGISAAPSHVPKGGRQHKESYHIEKHQVKSQTNRNNG